MYSEPVLSDPPTPELVRRVQELYPKRVSDVRFIIPVLTGISKVRRLILSREGRPENERSFQKEILAVMPDLIRLKPEVVKQVFNRLLHGKSKHLGFEGMDGVENAFCFRSRNWAATVESGRAHGGVASNGIG